MEMLPLEPSAVNKISTTSPEAKLACRPSTLLIAYPEEDAGFAGIFSSVLPFDYSHVNLVFICCDLLSG